MNQAPGKELQSSFINYLGNFVNLEKKEIDNIIGHARYACLSKNEILVKSGDICRKVAFFNRGYFRFFHLHPNGNEITSDFYFAPGFITSYTSFITGKPSFVNVQVMEDMEVLFFTRDDIYDLYSGLSGFERLGRLIAEEVAISSEKHLFLLLNHTAEQRYRSLLKEYPEYVQNIPLQYIASFLGIKRESLSRIRKSI